MPNIIEISDLSAPELDVYARLTQAQLRNRLEPEKGIFIAESPKVIDLALKAGCIPLSFLMERKHIDGQAAELIAHCDVPVYTADRDVLANLTGYELTRGILCAMGRPALPAPADILHDACRVAVLCGIVDSTNVGAIFRSAAALGMDAVLVTPECCDPLCRRSVRVSMGTVFQTPWTVIESIDADRNVVLVHGCMATKKDIRLIDDHFTRGATWALCPESNRFISNIKPPVELFRTSGARVGIGTDSLASARSLSMVDNMRQLGDIPLVELLTWATLNGAKALGIDDRMGEIAVGKRPGLVIIQGVDLHSLRLTDESCAHRLV